MVQRCDLVSTIALGARNIRNLVAVCFDALERNGNAMVPDDEVEIIHDEWT
jgi:hypothetical protein